MACRHRRILLLTRVLRDEWGYDGLVMSDWYGIKDRPASLLAGNDLAMPETRRDKQTLLAAIHAGEVPMAVVDRACLRMLTLLDKVQRHRRPQTQADFRRIMRWRSSWRQNLSSC